MVLGAQVTLGLAIMVTATSAPDFWYGAGCAVLSALALGAWVGS